VNSGTRAGRKASTFPGFCRLIPPILPANREISLWMTFRRSQHACRCRQSCELTPLRSPETTWHPFNIWALRGSRQLSHGVGHTSRRHTFHRPPGKYHRDTHRRPQKQAFASDLRGRCTAAGSSLAYRNAMSDITHPFAPVRAGPAHSGSSRLLVMRPFSQFSPHLRRCRHRRRSGRQLRHSTESRCSWRIKDSSPINYSSAFAADATRSAAIT
jgi:hypothetical protein